MACRLPGGIDSPQELWEALLRGEDFVGEIPSDRWDADVYYDPEPGVPGRSVTRWGAFLDDVGGFDADFFGMTDREATAIDPQHRLLLDRLDGVLSLKESVVEEDGGARLETTGTQPASAYGGGVR